MHKAKDRSSSPRGRSKQVSRSTQTTKRTRTDRAVCRGSCQCVRSASASSFAASVRSSCAQASCSVMILAGKTRSQSRIGGKTGSRPLAGKRDIRFWREIKIAISRWRGKKIEILNTTQKDSTCSVSRSANALGSGLIAANSACVLRRQKLHVIERIRGQRDQERGMQIEVETEIARALRPNSHD